MEAFNKHKKVVEETMGRSCQEKTLDYLEYVPIAMYKCFPSEDFYFRSLFYRVERCLKTEKDKCSCIPSLTETESHRLFLERTKN